MDPRYIRFQLYYLKFVAADKDDAQTFPQLEGNDRHSLSSRFTARGSLQVPQP